MTVSFDEGELPDVESLFEEAPCGLMVLDVDGTIRRANRTVCRWIGWSATDLLQQKRRLQDLLTVGGRIFHQTHWVPLLEMQGSVSEVKLDILDAQGRRIPMLLNAVRRTHGATVYHEVALAVAEDRNRYERELLDARRRAEELLVTERATRTALAVAQARLRLARESALLFLWDADPATRVRRYDDETAMLIGLPAAEPVTEARYCAAIDAADRDREAQVFEAAMTGTSDRYACVYRLNGLDGQLRTVSAFGRAYADADGQLQGFVGVLYDVSEISQERAAAIDRASFAEQMMGIVGHDLRNPLSAIHMSAALLARASLPPEQALRVTRIDSAARRAQRLIGDLLDFTAVRLGRGLPVAARPAHLHDAVREILDELAVSFPGRQIDHRPTGPGECSVDRDRLAQLVGNLVANAVTYGSPDTAIVVESCTSDLRCSVSVANDGTSIAEHLLPTLFEPMTRGGDHNDGLHSVGLGLFIVQQIARAHHGDVHVSSANHHTVFTVDFPRLSGAAS